MYLLRETISAIQPLDQKVMAEAQVYLDSLLKPSGSLGKLEDLARQVAGMTGKVKNTLAKKAIIAMCSDNGITEENIASTPKAISMLVADCMLQGTAGVAVLGRHAGADMIVVDLGLETDVPSAGIINRKIRQGTHNFIKQAAMSRDEAIRAIEIGIEVTQNAIDKGYQLIGTGEVGIANTTTSSAVLYALTNENLDLVVGRGAGLTDDALQRKKEVVRKGVEKHQPDPNDPIDILAKVGGFDIAGMTGTFLGAASRRTPVVIDGFISGVAALLACKLCPEAKAYMIPSHGSAEPGAMIVMRELGLEPMLYMNMRLGEGTGAALAFHLIDAAMYMINHQGTFDDIGMIRTN